MFRDKTVYSSSKHRSKTHFSNPRFLQSVPHFSPTRCSCLAAFIRLSLTNLFLVAASCPASCRTFTAESNITTLQTVIHTPLVKTDRVVHAMCPSQNLLSLSCRQLPVGCHFSHKMTPEKPKRELWVGHGLEPRPQFHVNEICGGKLKKHDILAPSSLRPSTLRPSTLRVPTLRAPTLRAFTLRSPFTRHTLRGPSEVGNRFFWRENPFFRRGRFQNRFFFGCVPSHAKKTTDTRQKTDSQSMDLPKNNMITTKREIQLETRRRNKIRRLRTDGMETNCIEILKPPSDGLKNIVKI